MKLKNFDRRATSSLSPLSRDPSSVTIAFEGAEKGTVGLQSATQQGVFHTLLTRVTLFFFSPNAYILLRSIWS